MNLASFITLTNNEKTRRKSNFLIDSQARNDSIIYKKIPPFKFFDL